jgi:PadR family transcriptional regulator, regulatory protein PadR
MKAPAILLRGTLDVLILRTLLTGALHGYAIAAQIEERTDGVLQIDDGALYQSLHRMEERGLVESEWGHADSGRRARFYALTREGRQRVKQETAGWVRYAEAVFKVLQPERA